MNISKVLGVLVLSSLPLSLSVASERSNEAINQCLEQAHEEYQVEPGKAKFWQMSQAGRFIRVWMKVRTGEDERVKALCKVRKGNLLVSEITEISS